MFGKLREVLLPGMQHAAGRLDRYSGRGIDYLLMACLCVSALGVVMGALGGYHAAFVPLHAALGSLLPDVAWALVTRLGDERVLLVLTLLFARRRPEIFWAMVLATVMAVLYARSLKHVVDALRPPAVLPGDMLHVIGPVLRSHSFPSGHTTSVFVFAGVLFAFARRGSTRAALLGLAILVGLSRVALGVHWPQDVLAGAFGGLLAASLGTWLSLYWRAGLRPGVHLGLLLLPVAAMPWLLWADNGNPHLPWLTWPLVFAMLMQLVLDYRVYRPHGSA
jgi:membrane-associated phospholipid phosphatase